ncbi:Ankyrin repeats (3 copies) [Carpediemonas membranifera]|uniref:Ankyrin repeats (3 copies) n=1 Tax=Carpediemonas membranifera TaxID=201153 RepID=A0A8J6AQ33_9EUKA|nr:Ankyrin repeats (3 copies) [Carpediemonas membranifera]|eukprot:KAG9390901.1 Ankyrin repeats (3 copies) [Carpediemonas membranifera]
MASYYGHLDCVRLLIDSGADCARTLDDGSTALFQAARNGHDRVIELLLDTNPDLVDVVNKHNASSLYAATLYEHVACARALLERGAKPDHRTKSGGTPLIAAASSNNTDLVKTLLDAHASVDLRNGDGDTALMCACIKGHAHSARILLDAGANGSFISKSGSCLCNAAWGGHDDLVLLLLQGGIDADVTELSGATPLIWAVLGDRPACVRLLLQAGCDLNARRKDGSTVTFIAAEKGYLEVLRLLVGSGANVEIPRKGKLGRSPTTPREIAQSKGHTDCVALLDHPELCGPLDFEVGSLAVRPNRSGVFKVSLSVALDVSSYVNKRVLATNWWLRSLPMRALLSCQGHHRRGLTGFHHAVYNGNVDLAGLIAFSGGDDLIHKAADGGLTPLYLACGRGEIKAVEYLLSKGANPNVPTSNGGTPLGVAVRQGFGGVVRLLLDAGAECTEVYPGGNSALHVAVEREFVGLVKMLLDTNPDLVGTVNQTRWAPLHIAASRGYTTIVSLLVKAGAPLDITTNHDRTALLLACNNGHADCVAVLLDAGSRPTIWCLANAARLGYTSIVIHLLRAGADVNERVLRRATPLHFASAENRPACVRLLLQAGCDVNARDRRGSTAVFMAAEKGHFYVIKMLIAAGADILISRRCRRNKAMGSGAMLPRDVAKANNHKLCVNLLDHPEDYRKIAISVGSFEHDITPSGASIPPAKDKVVVLASVYVALYTDADVPRASRLLAEFKSASSPGQLRKLASQIQAIQTDIDRLTPVLSLAKDPMPALKDCVREALERSDAFHAHVIGGNIRRIWSKPLFRRDKFSPVVLNCLDRDGRSPLYNAFISGQAKVFAALLKTGGLVDDDFPDGHPLLAIEGRPAMLDAILKAKVDINLVNRGTTALVAAIQGGHVDSARKLLSHGADPLLPADGVNAMHAIRAFPDTVVAKGLLCRAHGMHPHLVDAAVADPPPAPPVAPFPVIAGHDPELHDGFCLGNASYRNNTGGGDCAFFTLHNLDPTIFSGHPAWTRAAARALLGSYSAPIDLTETGYTHEELRGMFEGKNFVNLPALWAIQLYLSGRIRAETVGQFELIQYACVSAGSSVHRSIERFHLELSDDMLVLRCTCLDQYAVSRFVAFAEGIGFSHGHYFNVYPTADVPRHAGWHRPGSEQQHVSADRGVESDETAHDNHERVWHGKYGNFWFARHHPYPVPLLRP